MLFVSDSCRGRNCGGDGFGNRSSGVVAKKTEAVVCGGSRNRGSGSENIEAAEPVAEK